MTKPSVIKHKSRCPSCYTPVPANLWVMLAGLGEEQQLKKPQCSPSLLTRLELRHTLLILEVTPSCAYFVQFGQAGSCTQQRLLGSAPVQAT